ncbi:hypothetical protein FX988_04127 [Paraglaciecola mesophila]|uniref:PepSY domain-containing protein n=1 Tax=Paraglaciecola mesophila TaxID=197222 RepID=A0A857JSD0_9ALTE|nr:PepSY-associated TM helix domain-containing protein [Paraglaciecola mesophila]QHJ13847.1 hypothetical protein FX988_04127 [Paraglaciecola mesophila]
MRLRHGQRIFLSDLHKLLGLWGLWFSTLIAITGAWYFYEFGSAIADSRVEPSAPVLAHARANNHVISVNEFNAIIKRAYDAHEDWEITALYMPYSETTPIQLRGVSHHNPIIRNRALRVFIDPQSHDIVDT